MAFIPKTLIGKRVILLLDVEVLSGTFEKGTEMTITGCTERGYDLIDDEGNKLLETGIMSTANGEWFREIK